MPGMNLRDAAQQALDALRRIETLTSADWMLASKAVRDLSAALDAPPCATQDCMPAQCERCIDPEVK